MATGMAQNGLWYKRARLRGRVQQLRSEIRKQTQRLQQLQDAALTLQAAIEANQQTIARHQNDIETLTTALLEVFGGGDDGQSRKTCPKSEFSNHGSWTRDLLGILRDLGGQADADRLALELAVRWNLAYESPEAWRAFRQYVGTNLRNMKWRGLLIPQHAAQTSQAGIWALKDS